MTLGEIILRAYDVQPYQLKGAPSWLDSERYTIVGLYDFSLDFAPPPGVRAPPGPAGELLPGFTAPDPPPSIFQALRAEPGLRLEVVRGPVEFLIIDHAERVPTAN